MFSIVFPGQGSQKIGMVKEFYEKYDIVDYQLNTNFSAYPSYTGLGGETGLNYWFNNEFLEELLTHTKYKQINLEEINKFDHIVVLVEKGKVNYKKLELINTYISVYKNKFRGWILIDNVFNFI